MDTSENFPECWVTYANTLKEDQLGPHIHEADAPLLGRSAHRSFRDHVRSERLHASDLHFSLLPAPYVGNLARADIQILLINWGLEDSDYFSHEHKEFREVWIRNLKQTISPQEFPFFCLNPDFCWTAGYQYWEPRVRPILELLLNSKFLDAIQKCRKEEGLENLRHPETLKTFRKKHKAPEWFDSKWINNGLNLKWLKGAQFLEGENNFLTACELGDQRERPYYRALRQLADRVAVVQRVAHISRTSPNGHFLSLPTSLAALKYVQERSSDPEIAFIAPHGLRHWPGIDPGQITIDQQAGRPGVWVSPKTNGGKRIVERLFTHVPGLK